MEALQITRRAAGADVPRRSVGRVLVVGSGKIGCGLLAPTFAQAGWRVTLAARSEAVVERIRAAGHFTVRITGDGGVRRVTADAVLVGSPEFDRAVVDADLVATAVGSGSVAGLGPVLARALAARGSSRPVDVWTVENSDVAPVLRSAVQAAARRRGLRLPRVGFAGAIAFTAVTQGDWKTAERPEFVGDTARWLLVDAERLVGGMPRLPRVGATGRYAEHLQAKRLVFSAGHALCAYLGVPRGHRWVHEAVGDPLIRPLVERSLLDARRVLTGAPDAEAGPAQWALQRYANAELRDPLERVARDPLRKLSPHGPLVEPARMIARATGRVPAGFAAAIVGALLHHDPRDLQSVELAGMLAAPRGLERVLQDVCRLELGEPLACEVMRRYRRATGADRLASRRPTARPWGLAA